jgi:isocitrate/isopropylmalate dehydrogenase
MADHKTHKVTLIPGDGIGPEVTQAVVRILEATGVKFEWERFAAGAEAFEIYGEYIPAALSESRRRRLQEHQRHIAQEIRALRQLPPHQESARHGNPLA